MDPLFPTPARYGLPLSKGGDLVVDFMNKPGGTFTAYDGSVSVSLVIDTDTPIVATATITGYHAVCKVQSDVADTVKIGTLWRCIVSTAGSPSTEVVAVNGRVVRADGS